MVAVSCCNSQSETLILGNKPIRLRESYIQRLLFLCVMILVMLSKKNIFLDVDIVVKNCQKVVNNILTTVMTHL